MKFLITGSTGFLGSNLIKFFNSKGYEVLGTYHREPPNLIGPVYHQGDLLDKFFLNSLISREHPHVVINCVGMVDLNVCEENPSLAEQANAKTVENLAEACTLNKVRLIHISTDHLFDGMKSYYTEEDKCQPVNQYGLSKREGEKRCLTKAPGSVVIRTNFYGWSFFNHPPTFGEWLYNSLKEKKSHKVIYKLLFFYIRSRVFI